MTVRSAVARAAVLAVSLLCAGCAGTDFPLLAQLSDGDTASGGDAAKALATSEGTAPDAVPAPVAQLAALPSPGALRPPKPPISQAPTCATLEPGARAHGMVESGRQRFAIECFRAKADGPAPAVLILHGARGIGRNTVYERLAERLVDAGYNAFVMDYLAPVPPPQTAAKKGAAPSKPQTGKAQSAMPAAARATTTPRRRLMDNETQARAIEDAIGAIQALPYVDDENIGLFGLSLGGFHALAIAAHDPRVKAVVNMFGAMPRQAAPGVYRMPPTLILHGERDNVVPVRRAHELARLLKDIGADYELKIYKGQGHSFRGAADADSLERSTGFLLRWLGGRPAFDDRAG